MILLANGYRWNYPFTKCGKFCKLRDRLVSTDNFKQISKRHLFRTLINYWLPGASKKESEALAENAFEKVDNIQAQINKAATDHKWLICKVGMIDLWFSEPSSDLNVLCNVLESKSFAAIIFATCLSKHYDLAFWRWIKSNSLYQMSSHYLLKCANRVCRHLLHTKYMNKCWCWPVANWPERNYVDSLFREYFSVNFCIRFWCWCLLKRQQSTREKGLKLLLSSAICGLGVLAPFILNGI